MKILALVLMLISGLASANPDATAIKKHFGLESEADYIKGHVVEFLNSGGYTYVKLATEPKVTVWAATYEFHVKKGDLLRFRRNTPMENFKSRNLDRVFSSIYFVEEVEKAQKKSETVETH